MAIHQVTISKSVPQNEISRTNLVFEEERIGSSRQSSQRFGRFSSAALSLRIGMPSMSSGALASREYQLESEKENAGGRQVYLKSVDS